MGVGGKGPLRPKVIFIIDMNVASYFTLGSWKGELSPLVPPSSSPSWDGIHNRFSCMLTSWTKTMGVKRKFAVSLEICSLLIVGVDN
jgi:hypothetical protein